MGLFDNIDWGGLIGAGVDLVGGYLGQRGREEAAEQANRVPEEALRSRREAAQLMSPEGFTPVANWLFPGLLPPMGGVSQAGLWQQPGGFSLGGTARDPRNNTFLTPSMVAGDMGGHYEPGMGPGSGVGFGRGNIAGNQAARLGGAFGQSPFVQPGETLDRDAGLAWQAALQAAQQRAAESNAIYNSLSPEEKQAYRASQAMGRVDPEVLAAMTPEERIALQEKAHNIWQRNLNPIFNAPGLKALPYLAAAPTALGLGGALLGSRSLYGAGQALGGLGNLAGLGEQGMNLMERLGLARADGGPVAPGQPYLVGEEGPEIVVPTRPGNVIPSEITEEIAPTVGPTRTPSGNASPTETADRTRRGQSGPTRRGTSGGGGGEPGIPDGGPSPEQGPLPSAMAALYPGQLATAWTMDMLTNPGRVDPTAYHRAQEQANVALGGALQGIGGALTGRGIDLGSGMGQTLATGAALASGNQRMEAARDLASLQEAMRRQDIGTGIANYLNFLGAAQGYQGNRANTLMGGSWMPFQPVNTTQPYADALTGVLSPYLQSLFGNQNNDSGIPSYLDRNEGGGNFWSQF